MNKEEMQDIKERLDLFPESMNKEAQEGYYKLFDYINKIEEENKQLKENWNKLYKILEKKETTSFGVYNKLIRELIVMIRKLEKSDINE